MLLMGGCQRQGIGVGGIIVFIFSPFFYGIQNSFKFHWFWVKPESGMCEVGEIINILSLEKDKGQHVSQGVFWFVWSWGFTSCDDMILHNWQGLDQSLIQGQRQGEKPYWKALCKWLHCMKLEKYYTKTIKILAISNKNDTMWASPFISYYFPIMIKGIEYTKTMDQKVIKYQKENLLTIKEFTQKASLTESSLYKFRNRGKISVKSLKKIKDNLWLDLFTTKK